MYSTILWRTVTMRGGRDYGIICAFNFGRLAEWLNAAVLKTVDPQGSGGSNPSLSAIQGEVAKLCAIAISVISPLTEGTGFDTLLFVLSAR